MEFEELLKKIDDYFENITEEQLEQDLKDIGIDEMYEYMKEEQREQKVQSDKNNMN